MPIDFDPTKPNTSAKTSAVASFDPTKPASGKTGGEGWTKVAGINQYAEDYHEQHRRSSEDLAGALGGFFTPPDLKHLDPRHPTSFLSPGAVITPALNWATDWMVSPFTTAAGRPVEKATHGAVKKETVGNLASVLVPGAGEMAGERALVMEAARLAKAKGITQAQALREIKFSRNPTRVPKTPEPAKPRNAEQAKHQERAERVRQQGIVLTKAQREGGVAKAREDRAANADPYKQQGIQQARKRTQESFHRATYNKALEHINQKMGIDSPVGHEGVAEVHRRIDAAYNQVLANAKARLDEPFQRAMQNLNVKVNQLPRKYRKEFARIIADEVTQRFRVQSGTASGMMTGAQFKEAESTLEREAAAFRGSPNPRDRKLGSFLEEAAVNLRDSVERNSPAPVVDRLRKVDKAYAIYKRIEQATNAAGREDGMFTPGQFIDATKAPLGMPSRTRRAAFARGNALLQDFAQDAHAVTKGKGGSDTAINVRTGSLGRIIGSGIGGALGYLKGGHGIPGLGLGGFIGERAGALADRPIAEWANARTARELERQMTPVLRQAMQSPRLGPTAAGAGVMHSGQRRKRREDGQ